LKVLSIIFLALAFSLKVLAAGVGLQAVQNGDSIHLEFKGQSQWDYNVDKKSEKNSTFVSIEVPRLSEPAVMSLKSFQSPVLSSVDIKHDGPDGKDVLVLKLSGGSFETFDYLTDQPSRLIIDIYQTPEKTAAKVAVATKKAVNKKLPGKRAPSSEVLVLKQDGPLNIPLAFLPNDKTKGIFDGGDPNYERFQVKDYEIKEESVIASRENYYIDFPMLRIGNQQIERLNSNKPIYEIEPKDTEENKMARLLLTLYEKKRYNVFLKTIDWFYQKYPQSEYDEIISFVWADVYYAMWMEKRNGEDFDLAITRYRQALMKHPKSPLLERTLMLMGFSSMDRGDFLGTLKLFQNHLQNRPQSPNRDIARHAVAESYLKLNRYEDSFAVLDDIEKEASAKKYQTHAAYLKGDVFFQKKDYQAAIKEYQRALEKFPEGRSEYPNVYYNQASAYFGLGKYKESLNTFLSFIKQFPAHEYAGYAMTRVGEILDIFGVDKARVMGAYLETQFRYGNTPGSVVAKLRLLCARMKGMKPKEVEKAVEEIIELSQMSDLEKVDQFAKVLISDGYSSRHEFEKSVQLLVSYYQAHPTTADTKLLTNRIIKYINEKFAEQVKSGQFIEALRTHKKYADNWLKGSSRIDTKFNIGLAYEQAGVFAESDKMYRETINKILAIKGTPAEKEVNIFEKLPDLDEVYLRAAKVNSHQARFAEAYDYLRQIKTPEKLSEVSQIERVQLAADLLERKGDLESASRYLVELIKTWKGLPQLVAEPYLTLASIEQKTGKTDEALKSYQKIDQLVEDSGGQVSQTIHVRALENLAKIYLQKGDTKAGLAAYEKLLERYEQKIPLDSIRYKTGLVYFQQGEMQKAADIWNSLRGRKNEFWYNLAQEQLKNSEWNMDYKRYINRIPAMSERK
jgi:tetratricopeptide (TPR) repeat protein